MTGAKTIICAVRGGEGSRRVQNRAIALGKEQDAPVVFVHVIDPATLKAVDPSLAKAVAQELEMIAGTLLRIATERAKRQGLQVDRVVLHGPVTESLCEYVCKTEGATLILGSHDPKTNFPDAVETNDLENLIAEVQRRCQAQVVVV